MARAYKGCVICKGQRGLPRNGKAGKTCTANQCKLDYKEQRALRSIAPTDGLANYEIAAQAAAKAMPDGMWVHEIEEVLGERCCKLHTLSKKKRKNGPVTRAAPTAKSSSCVALSSRRMRTMKTRMTIRREPNAFGLRRVCCSIPLLRAMSKPLWRSATSV